MSVEDPFFVVKSEVEKSINNCRELHSRWRDMLNETKSMKRGDYDKVSNDLRNGLRSIEWDLEDLDETIGIVECNPAKFRIDGSELSARRDFISATRNRIVEMKNELNDPQAKAKADKLLRNNLLHNGLNHKKDKDRYSRLHIANENENNAFIDDHQQKQQLIIEQQDEQLEMVADSVGMLKNMSRSIGNELDEQSVMLDGLGHEMETTQNRMDTLLRKMAKVTKMSSDRRQWCAICILGSCIFILFLCIVI